MGLKGFRLWVMGQLDSTRRAPPRWHTLPGTPACPSGGPRGVAAQVDPFHGKQTLKPVFSLDRFKG
jgi:hypothetical protein